MVGPPHGGGPYGRESETEYTTEMSMEQAYDEWRQKGFDTTDNGRHGEKNDPKVDGDPGIFRVRFLIVF